MTQPQERRRSQRALLEGDIAFRRPRESHYTIQIHDLSPHGCRVACPERLDQGELVWVQLPSLESLPAWVRWARAADSGVEFDQPMHRAVFEMMARRMAPAEA